MNFFATIPAIEDRPTRPLWTVLIPCYNCADFLRTCLKSVLDQDIDLKSMEIIVIDDCSSVDDPKAVVDEIGAGRVRFIRQPTNVGKVRNYETGLLASRGHLIHQLHADDLVLPGFYAAMEAAFTRFPEAGAFFCECDYINHSGIVTGKSGMERSSTGVLHDWLSLISISQRIQTPSMVVKRVVYERLGGFDRRLDCSEDWEMWVRIALNYPVGFSLDARSQYRYSAGNNTSRSILNGSRATIQRKMFQIVDSYLPPALVSSIRSQRNAGQALFFADQIPGVVAARGFAGWTLICFQIFSFSFTLVVLRRVLGYTRRILMCSTCS